MKRILIIGGALFALLIHSPSLYSQPQPKDFGFGLILGDPTGLSLRGATSGNNCWDAAIGTSWFGNLHIHADYLWAVNAFNSSKAGLYFGIGGVIGSGEGRTIIFRRGETLVTEDNGLGIGARVVGGFNAMPFNAPVELFVELAPIIALVPNSGVGMQAAGGIRFYP